MIQFHHAAPYSDVLLCQAASPDRVAYHKVSPPYLVLFNPIGSHRLMSSSSVASNLIQYRRCIQFRPVRSSRCVLSSSVLCRRVLPLHHTWYHLVMLCAVSCRRFVSCHDAWLGRSIGYRFVVFHEALPLRFTPPALPADPPLRAA